MNIFIYICMCVCVRVYHEDNNANSNSTEKKEEVTMPRSVFRTIRFSIWHTLLWPIFDAVLCRMKVTMIRIIYGTLNFEGNSLRWGLCEILNIFVIHFFSPLLNHLSLKKNSLSFFLIFSTVVYNLISLIVNVIFFLRWNTFKIKDIYIYIFNFSNFLSAWIFLYQYPIHLCQGYSNVTIKG